MDTKMKKADWVTYASELECKLVKAKAEVERIRAERIEAVRDEIREEERKEWIETGLRMAYDELISKIFEMETWGEITDDIAFRLKTKILQCLDALDVASIVE